VVRAGIRSVTLATPQLGWLPVKVGWKPRYELLLAALMSAAAEEAQARSVSLQELLAAAGSDNELREFLQKVSHAAVLMGKPLAVRVAREGGGAPDEVLQEVGAWVPGWRGAAGGGCLGAWVALGCGLQQPVCVWGWLCACVCVCAFMRVLLSC
jgi:hypothetical protein